MSIFNKLFQILLSWVKKFPLKKTSKLIKKYPFRAFFLTLFLLFVVILLGNLLNTPTKLTKQKAPIIQVQTYQIGTPPMEQLQAQIQKSGVVSINSQANGIIQTVNVTEGQNVSKGTNLVYLSSNYQGGSSVDIQAEIAQKQNQITDETYQEQKDILAKQQDLANNTQSNNDQLRALTADSATESANLINQNQTILNTINQNLQNLQTYDATNSAAILQTEQLQAQYQGTINQLNSQQRQLAYQADANQPYTQIQYDQRDIALKQLNIQEKTLDINKEISELQLQLAYINQSLMYPASPCDGVVDKIYVTFGQQVNSGTPLASISCNDQTVKAILEVPANLAETISRVQPSLLHVNNQTFKQTPDYISRDATDGSLYSVIYILPSSAKYYLSNSSYISVEVPIGIPNTSSVDPYVPLDAIYQTETSAYVFKIVKDKAQSINVQLGDVYGSYVSVLNGLNNGDTVILNRNVINGDRVTISK